MIFTAIGSFVATSLFTSAAAIAVATKVIAGGLAIAFQAGLSYLTRAKQRPYAAVQGQVDFGTEAPVSTVYGTTAVAGHIVEHFEYGKGNIFNSDVYALANGWCDGLEPKIIFYGEEHDLIPVPVEGNEVERYQVSGFGSLITIRFFDGRPGQLADTDLISATQGLSDPWTSTDVLDGICYVSIDQTYNQAQFDRGFPEYQFILRGLKEYDPRKDDTVAGGSGPHRLNDPATWEHSLNPAVHRVNYALGVRGLASDRPLLGMGKSISEIDLSSHITAMNICDQTRLVDGRIVKRYECSLFVQSTDDHSEILSEFEDAMAGYRVDGLGLFGVIAGAPQVTVFDLTDADIDSGRPLTVQYRRSSLDTINHLTGNFTSPEALWTSAPLTPISVPADVAADKAKRSASNDFLQVTDPDIAQYLLTIRYRQNRLGASANIPVSRRLGFYLQVGDWITWNSRTWRVSKVQIEADLLFTIELEEVSVETYDEGDIEAGPIVLPPVVPINPSEISTISGFSIASGSLETEDGQSQPFLRATWIPPNDPTVTAVVISYWNAAAPNEIFKATSPDPESGELLISENVLPGAIYRAQATIRTNPDRFKTDTQIAETSAATPSRSLAISLPDIRFDIRETIEDMRRDLDLLVGEVERLADANAGQAAIVEREATRIAAEVGGTRASISTERIARADGDSALATQVSDLNASLSGDITANADAISSLTTEVASKNSVYRQNAEPTGGTYVDGDLWIDTDDANRLYVWENDQWVDSSVAGMTVFSQDDPPVTTIIGALWFDTNNDDLLHEWDGSAWIPRGDKRIEAISTALTQVEAEIDNATAAGLVKIEAVASSDPSVLVRISNQLRASTTATDGSEVFREAGEFSEIYDDGGTLKSRKVFDFNQIIFSNSDNPTTGIVSDGTKIGTADGATQLGPDGLELWDDS